MQTASCGLCTQCMFVNFEDCCHTPNEQLAPDSIVDYETYTYPQLVVQHIKSRTVHTWEYSNLGKGYLHFRPHNASTQKK